MSKGKYCVNCSAPAMLLCSRCSDSYCTIECQKADWERHRFICFKMPTLVPDLDALERNMMISLSSTPSHNQTQINGFGLESPTMTPPRAIVEADPIPQMKSVTIQEPVKIQEAPVKKHVNTIKEPTRQVPEEKQNGDHEEMKPKPANQAQPALKNPVPTQAMKFQATPRFAKKAEPPKPVMITDLKVHALPTTPKVKVDIVTMPECNVLTVHETDEKINAAYDRITAEIADYCKGKKGGYTPIPEEVVLGLFDGNWYRAHVIDANNEKGFIVRYIEYGNIEIVMSDDLLPLPDNLKFEVYASDLIVDNMPENLSEKQEEILGSGAVTITNIKQDEEGILHCSIFGF